ncbi:MAG: translation initiation factor IF-1 [Verrucomicrobiota bacterium JB023]|nr:translation initiation factor IF-1 [Verrucomicrobiota bacterium JB023]
MPVEPIVAQATVTEERDHRTVMLELPNGKPTLGHLSRNHLHLRPSLTPGARVTVEMTPFDFEKARIMKVAE